MVVESNILRRCSVCSRPTAVNLADACNKLASIASASGEAPGATPQSVVEAVVMTAEAYYQNDIATCKVPSLFSFFGIMLLLRRATQQHCTW